MKELWQKVIRSKFFWLSLIIVVQSVVYFLAGSAKAYFHMDEVYSYGLANYERVQLYETEDFYNTWHDGRWYDDYLTVGGEERGDLRLVYINQKKRCTSTTILSVTKIGYGANTGTFFQVDGDHS